MNGSMKFGMLAEYATPADLMHAAETIRDAGFRRWDVFSPFPIPFSSSSSYVSVPFVPSEDFVSCVHALSLS